MGAKKNGNKSLKRPITDEGVDDSPKKKKFSYPSIEELTLLNEETRSLKSFFSLQTQELLKNKEIKNKLKKQLSLWLEEFQKFSNGDEIFSQSENSKLFKKIAKKLSKKLSCDQDLSINFVMPESMGTFGLYKMDSLPGPNIETSLYVVIPRKCLNAKDYLNNRYFVKKYFYLMYIAEYLQNQKMCSSIKCTYYNENPLLPYLVLNPKNSEKTTVRVFLVPEQNYFKETRYSPEVNNVKAQVFKQDFGNIDNIGELPTTFYNTALAFDNSLIQNHVFIEELFTSANLREGMKLIIIWMNQRKLLGSGPFVTDLSVYFLTYLISRGNITNIMTSEQVFRNFLYFIHTTDLTTTPLSLCEKLSEEELQKYKSAFDIVVMDKTGYYNVAAFLTTNTYLKMRYECKLALDLLDQSNCFSELFLTKVPAFLQHDVIIDVKSENDYGFLLKDVTPEEKAKYVGNYMPLIIKILLKYLNKGFNQRVKNIVPIIPSTTEWNYGETCIQNSGRIIFGIDLHLDLAYEILEFGPALNDPEEKNFKEFWGDLASNRRFRDGTAKVVVYFETNTVKGRREIIKTIADYVMEKKLNLKYNLVYNEFEEVLLNRNVETWYPSGTNEETTLKIVKSSDDLGQKIRSLDMELGVSGIGGISDVFCNTNVFPPIPCSYTCHKKITMLIGNNIVLKNRKLMACPRYVEPIECVIQLSHSSKWPGDLNELRQKKIEFLKLISSLLKKQYNIVSSVQPPYLEIVYEGFVFRYNLYVSKEIALLKRQDDSNSSIMTQNIDVGVEMEKNLILVPKIVGALKGLNAQYPSYGVSTCLAKRWIRAQLIDEFLLPDMVIDLLNAHQFVHKSLYDPAVSPQIAFLRFLKFLADMQWDWQPIVINFNNVLSDDRISNIENEMDTNREKFPPLVIVTPYDDCNSIFTKMAPCKEVLFRLKELATEFLSCFEKMIWEDNLENWMALFLPNTDGFDCILHLKLLLNPRRHEQISIINPSKMIFKKPEGKEEYLPVIKFNPVEMYLEKLRNIYGDLCVFFHDTYGGDYIAVLWKPEAPKEDIRKGIEILGRDIIEFKPK
ncbi:nucleolar protein 6-like [Coccinella septempunctata]|uniref:nucleolar protein 6-like n=1 Tax=Coccinella septempunctata TaxID=41139 RepID=UPI001D08AE2B|nr:nucleolar protein 6-like [Coccinella septempunctata]